MRIDDGTSAGLVQTLFNTAQTKSGGQTGVSRQSGTGCKNSTRCEVIPPSSDRIQYSKLENVKATAHNLVQGIRSVDRTIRLIAENVDKMDQALLQAAKNYPPFPAGSSERITQLRQFSSLRKMIDKLTVPPKEEHSPEIILGDADRYPQSGDWRIAANSGRATLSLRHQPLHTGEQGLDIPDLPEDAPGEAIDAMRSKLADAKMLIQRRRQAFISDANGVIASILSWHE